MEKLLLLFNTVKYLKCKQIIYQLFYRVNKVKPLINYRLNRNCEVNFITISNFLKSYNYTDGLGSFKFLNQEVKFNGDVDWNFMDNGKLWNYNLHYANYILQEDISIDIRLNLLNKLHYQLNLNSNGLEPYPVSLRLINTIRFISRHKVENTFLLKNVEAEANFLSRRIEYHLLGNHVLENGFALLIAGVFFENKTWVEKADSLLAEQLSEQIMADGAHFELSPMYHQIILYRLLELIDWYSKWENHNTRRLDFYIDRAKHMLLWLKNITFKNGDIPLMNDSSNGIAYSSKELFDYSDHLGISFDSNLPLSTSGYRVFNNENYECIIDVGNISVNYQPGHGHADALSFILYASGRPFLIERGTSTYEIGKVRTLERSTTAHNTLVYKNKNQSQVWSGFRVGARAKVKIMQQTKEVLDAVHDGYKRYGGIHRRKFLFSLNEITIKDEFLTKNNLNAKDCVVNFHFHPSVSVLINDHIVLINNTMRMTFEGAIGLEIENYKFSPQFNKYEEGVLLKVTITNALKTIINF